MKLSSKILGAMLVASLSFGVAGCKGEPPEPPVAIGAAVSESNGAKISIVSFQIEEPDFLDMSGKAVRPSEAGKKVAVLRVKIENTKDKDISYKPLHTEGPSSRIQVCTDPNPETGARTDIKAISFAGAGNYSTAKQINQVETIAPNDSIIDEYLFEVPATSEKLVALIPSSIIGVTGKVYRFYVDDPTKNEIEKAAPAKLKEKSVIDGVEVTVTSVTSEHAELVQKNPTKKFKYPFAYTDEPVMAVRIKIRNTSGKSISYDPQHGAETVKGISMAFEGSAQARIRLNDNKLSGKGQVTDKISIANGETKEDVFFFSLPGSKGKMSFNLSGSIFGVRGMYRFAFNFVPEDVPAPDYHPYKKDGAEAPAAAAEAPAAEAPAAAAE